MISYYPLHFDKVDFVFEPGQFSIRGGIVDVFSYSNEHPYRLEFFGNEIETIRTFDPATQFSIELLPQIHIIPNIEQHEHQEKRVTLFDYFQTTPYIWMNRDGLIKDRLLNAFQKAETAYSELSNTVKNLSPDELYLHADNWESQMQQHTIFSFDVFDVFQQSNQLLFNQQPQPVFNKNFELLAQFIQEKTKNEYQQIITSNNPKQIERLHDIFKDIGKNISFSPCYKSFHEGFIDHELKICIYTDHQIFERFHRFKLKEGFKNAKQAFTIKEITNLQPGDFVTHIDHGIGRFSGLEKIDVNGKLQEAIRLTYQDGDILYVSIHSLHRISKYSGQDNEKIHVHKLGGKAWSNLKQKTKKKIKEIAFDLISLYAKRKEQKGFEYSPDTYLQNELEASFLYEDTPDQIKATNDFKRDMESPSPMDRLICGDVGFGKTEIAIRAAFKAVADSKQVAVMAPTTILTLQHFRTFSERLKDFPCKIDYINRFKTAKQQKETLRKLENGEIDIIIGTHRLVGKDIKFKDLGLLIVDEEQKFGVGAKDKIKTMKVNVDTLTLTATPIPRTLQFSLLGARDLSIINTPPPNRFPVHTELAAFNEEKIRDVIMYELSRNGQVFFVHNRIQNLQEIAGTIQRLIPDAKIAIAHGQMEGEKLENIMTEFMDGQYDVLVSTSIIESGIDISNANTIIINMAHLFGLSDLHQMRGRVGRSNKKAFCYLFTPPISSLTSDARKRLRAIEEFSDLGSGFNIAMKDLDIRGAGNLLGAEQSGFIADIGIETFHKILDEAVQELRENEFSEVFKEENAQKSASIDCVIETDLEILIPEDYVNNVAERLSLYKDIDNIENEEQLSVFETQMKDRFGPIPESTIELFNTLKMRWIAQSLGFEKIVLKNHKMIAYFVSNQQSSYYQSPIFNGIIQYIQKHPHACRLKEKNEKLYLTFEAVSSIEKANILLQSIKSDLSQTNS
jgi:transcription-repair coupling factor (superfamily II helicase)